MRNLSRDEVLLNQNFSFALFTMITMGWEWDSPNMEITVALLAIQATQDFFLEAVVCILYGNENSNKNELLVLDDCIKGEIKIQNNNVICV